MSSGGASYDELVSIEHVLLQTVEEGSQWAAWFPDEERSGWTHRIANLVFLTHRINIRASNWDFDKKKKQYFASSDGTSPFVITQGVLQDDNWTPQHLAIRQIQLIDKLCQVWQLDSVEVNQELVEATQEEKGLHKVADIKLIDSKREEIMAAFGLREKVNMKKKGAQYWTEDGKMYAICTISKRYKRTASPYWYGYSTEWQKFLLKGKASFLVLGCLDRGVAYAVPSVEIEKILPDLYRTSERHWHIVLDENELGALELVPKIGPRVPLTKFELKVSN